MTADVARKSIQTLLGGLKVDGDIRHATLTRLELLCQAPADSEWPPAAGVHAVQASSFADPADVLAFKRCKATGKSDQQCFAVGDNGMGQFGKITAQNDVPMCAIHADDMKAEWGGIDASAHQSVKVSANGKTVICSVEDRLGVRNRIDLNPAAAAALGLVPPFLVAATWQRA